MSTGANQDSELEHIQNKIRYEVSSITSVLLQP